MGKRRNRKEKTEGGREETLGTSPGLHPPKTRASPASTFSSIVILRQREHHQPAPSPPSSSTGLHFFLLLHRHPPTTRASPASTFSSCYIIILRRREHHWPAPSPIVSSGRHHWPVAKKKNTKRKEKRNCYLGSSFAAAASPLLQHLPGPLLQNQRQVLFFLSFFLLFFLLLPSVILRKVYIIFERVFRGFFFLVCNFC